MSMGHKRFALLLAVLMAFAALGSLAEVTLDQVNEFLNTSAKLGEGTKANPVAIIPIHHIDGPQEEDLFYGFVSFKYEARNYIKYQVSFISCTCRSADVNVWSSAYVELTLPESGLLDDAVVRTLSFDQDSTGRYTAAFWGDSNPIPSGQTYELFKTEYIPYYVGKTYADVKGWSTIRDIDPADYSAGEGRTDYSVDAYAGATVSANNVLRMLQAMFEFHGSDPYFKDDPAVGALLSTPATKEDGGHAVAAGEGVVELAELPAPVDLKKTFKPSKDEDEIPCTPASFGPTCSAIDNSNLLEYINRPDVLYIDLRDFSDYMKKHFRNFEVVPFFALIFNAEAHTNAELPQLYGGSPDAPVPVYEESDDLLSALFPKDKTLFLFCQSGGRVGMMMNILAARGWDMSKIYNIGGMAQYTAPEYKPYITDTPEMAMEATYSFESLTRIAP